MHDRDDQSTAGQDNGAPPRLIRAFMPELDSLRGIAALSVVFLHGFFWRYGALPFSGAPRIFMLLTRPGWVGVNLFFVLSGFLITGILLDSKNEPDYFRRFYVRRALRILPAYYGLLLVLALLHQASSSFLVLSFFYLANFTDFFGVAMDYGPLWSLAVEEHYYILWPAIVKKFSTRSLIKGLLAICVLVPLARLITFRYFHGVGLNWYTWLVADGLAAGSLLAIVLRRDMSREKTKLACGLFLSAPPLLGLTFARLGILTERRILGAALQYSLVNIFFVGFVILFLLLGTSPYRGYVNSVVLRFFGYISYGVYLIHFLTFRLYDIAARRFWPQLQPSVEHFSLVWLRFVVAAGLSIGIAFLSRRYFEDKFLRLKRHYAP